MAWESVLGRLPFLGDEPSEVLQQHLHAAPPKVRSIWPEAPAPLVRLLDAMLAKNPAARPSLAEVRATFLSLRGVRRDTVRQSAVTASWPGAQVRRARVRWVRWPRTAASALAVPLVALLGLGALALAARMKQPPLAQVASARTTRALALQPP